MFRIMDSVVDHNTNISRYKLSNGSSYIKLPKELDRPRKDMINSLNIDDNALNGVWSNISSADHNPAKLRKADKNFPRELDFKDIKFSVKIRDIHKELRQH